MAWDPTTIEESQIRVAIKVTLLSPTRASQVFYWSDGDFTGDHVDGTHRHWEGRLRGPTKIRYPDQQLFGSTWRPPSCEWSIWVGDHTDAIWAYLYDSAYRWLGAEVTVYLVDMTQRAGAGATVQFEGILSSGVEGLGARVNSSLRFVATYKYAEIELPVNRLSAPTENASEFCQPRQQDTDTIAEDLDISETSVTLTLGGTHWLKIGRIAVVDDEAMYITAYSAVPPTITVIRGYARTTANTHTSGTSIAVYRNGILAGVAPSGGSDHVIPFIFGERDDDKGMYVRVYPYAFTGVGASDELEWWVSRGKCTRVATLYTQREDDIDDWPILAVPDQTYNDLDAPFATGHRTPNIILAGTYVTVSFATLGGWDSDADGAWVHTTGIDNGSGAPLAYACGIANYLATNVNWACGLVSPWYGNSITGATTGDWKGEFTGATWYQHICGIVPPRESSERPLLVDVLQELCAFTASDLFTRSDGTSLRLHPKRRKVATTANYTVMAADLYSDWPEQTWDRTKWYANRLTLDWAQDFLSSPKKIAAPDDDDMAPVAIPYSVSVEDSAEITLMGGAPDGIREAHLTPRWFTAYPAAAYDQSDQDQEQNAHLAYLEDVAELHLLHRKQGQVWMRARLCHRYLGIWQGSTIVYSISPYTTTKGQVREVEITIDGGKVYVDVLSWHLETWA